MTKQEEQLWNYIDGLCNATEKAEIEAKLGTDTEFQQLYAQLLELNKRLMKDVEIDEPSMSFMRNVMAQVETEIAPVSLKTKVDQRIIYVIGGFFSLILLSTIVYAFATADFTFKMPNIVSDLYLEKIFSPRVLTAFLFINVVLLLIYLDSFLRKGLRKSEKSNH